MTEEENKPEEEFADDNDALTLDDLSTGYISNPKVGGKPVVFTVKKITKFVEKNKRNSYYWRRKWKYLCKV